jgi:D-alanyl-lipoteichoic acid acyltransferase DltB (MBOAT superfamily)
MSRSSTFAGAYETSAPWRAEFGRETLAQWRVLLWIAVQAVGVGLLTYALAIEGTAFARKLLPLALGGAVANHLLPRAYRLTFFGLLSLLAIWVIFGLVDGTWLVALGLGIIAICHLPVAFGLRVALLLAVGLGCVWLRAGLAPSPWSMAVWPILGSMFMFRLVVYIYDIRHTKQRTQWEERIAYFFCLPNVAFPLFPVVDFATFRRTYYDRPAPQIYQEGIRWMVRGLSHLMLYRLIYQYGTIAPSEVATGAKLVQYLVVTYALYLRVSGQFHLIVGLLHLFGFRLPETHRFFFMASSFSDLWRRINIYWKDFMQKVFYMPVFFRLMRAHGETVALIVSTLVVTVATWALHSYQWFWILGTWLLTGTDVLFWAMLGVFLVANQLWEAHRGRSRSLTPPKLTPVALVRHGLQTALMFSVMCVLWSFWSAPSVDVFRGLFRSLEVSWRDVAVAGAALSAVALLAALSYRRANTPSQQIATYTADRPTLAGFAFLGLIVAGGSETGARLIPEAAHAVAVNVRDGRLNELDLAQQRVGYYETLNDVSRFNPELWRLYAGSARPQNEIPVSRGILQRVADARVQVVRPNLDVEDNGTRVVTNQWGMRDSAYSVEKPVNTWRIAVLGPSLVFGTGVANDETFEAVIERRLNAEEAGRPGRAARYEVLNFGVPAASAWQHLASMRLGFVDRFAPDVVLMVGGRNELWNASKYWQDVLKARVEHSLPEVLPLLRSTGITAEISRDSAEQLLLPVRDSVLTVLYVALAEEVRRMRALPVYAPIEFPLQRRTTGSVIPLLAKAERAGFVAFNLSHVYQGHDERTLTVSESNAHPNAQGHRLIAAGLYAELLKRPALLGGSSSGGTASP